MKKLTKILILVLSVALLAGVFMLASSATADAPEATTHVAFKIYDKTGTEITTNAQTVNGVTGYVTLKDAFDNATDGSTIKMVADFEMGSAVTPVYTSSRDLTIDFNGHTLAISYNKKDGAALSYQVVTANSGKTLTLTGNGTLKTSIAWMASGGTLVVDAGKGKTLNLKAIRGYEYKTADGSVALSSFMGNPLLKVGGNTNNNNSTSKLIIRGNLNIDCADPKGIGVSNMQFMAAYAGGTIEIENAKINAMTSASGHTFIAHAQLKNATTVNADWTGAKFSIKNSDIYFPYGKFIDLSSAGECVQDGDTYTEPKSTSRAPRVTIDNCNLDLYGAGVNVGSVFQLSTDKNIPAVINVSNTTILSDESVFQGVKNQIPAAVAVFKNSFVDISLSAATQYFANNAVTVILDDGTFVKADSKDTVFNNGYAFTTATQAAEGTALPRYADPTYEAEEWYVGGFGNLMKNGSATSIQATPGAPNTWYAGASAFAMEEGAFFEGRMIEHKGRIYSGFVATNEKSEYVIGGNRAQHLYTFEGYNMGGQSIVTFFNQASSVNVDGFSLILNGKRTGKYSAVQTLGGTNKYVTHEHYYDSESGKNGPYVNIQIVDYPAVNTTTGAVTPSTTNNIEDFRYYVVDFDTMSPTDNFTDTNVTFYYTSWHSKWSEKDSKYVSDHIIFDSVAVTIGGSAGAATVSGVPFEAGKGVWNHFTMILEVPLDADGKPDPTKINEADLYVYLNGEIITKKENVYPANHNYDPEKTDLFYDGKLDNVHIDEVRFNFPVSGANSDMNDSIAFDNVVMKQYYYDTALTKESIANEYKTLPAPEALPVAKVGSDYYYDMEAAFEDALWLAEEEDATIELFNDYEGLFNPDDYDFYFGDYDFTVITNGNKFAVDALSDYTMDDLGNGVYNVRVAEADEKATVTWYNADGTVLDTVTAIKGASITSPAIAKPEVVTEKYYVATYDQWGFVNEDGTYTLADDSFVVEKDVNLKPAASVAAKFEDMKFSLAMNDTLIVQYFIPKDLADGKVANVSKVSVDINGSKNRPVYTTIKVGDEIYNGYVVYPSYSGFEVQAKGVLNYTVTLNGIEYNFSLNYNVSPLQYAQFVLSSNQRYTAEEKTLVANLVRFVNEFNKAYRTDKKYNHYINDLYEQYKSLCTEYDESVLADTNLAMGDISKYVESIYLAVDGARMQYVIAFKPDSKVTSVNITKLGAESAFANTTISVYTADDRNYFYVASESDFTATAGEGAVKVKGDKTVDNKKPYQMPTYYYAEYKTENLRAYNFFGTIDIAITVEGVEGKITGQYDLGTWYNHADLSGQINWGDLFMAYKEFADSLYDYRITEVE